MVTVHGRQYLGDFGSQEQFAEFITRLRKMHPCPHKGRGKEDREATGERSVGLLSEWLRGIPDIRVIDVDKLIYCPRCWKSLLWIEEKRTSYSSDEWQMMRHLARETDSRAMFFLEEPGGSARAWIYPELAPDQG